MKKFLILGALALATPSHAVDLQKAVLAGGCFWCMESDFEKVDGVVSVISGFTGGALEDPNYKKSGNHLEAVEITYDADIVSYDALIHLFFRSVDPLDADGQFCDRGVKYSTAVFALTPAQREIAQTEIERINQSGALPSAIVTPVIDGGPFYPASEYHQDYYKSKKIVVTRFGPLTKEKAYKRYRKACGRDARVKELWGEDAFSLVGS